jgi:hypothetical protein
MALDPISAALDIGGKVIDRLWPDPAQAAAAKLELIKLQQSGELAQLAVNTEEAKHPSVFVSGWRPAIGWICGLACAWNWIGLPVVKVALLIWSNRTIPLAPADLTDMLPILVGMLGLSGYRTIERLNGVERK